MEKNLTSKGDAKHPDSGNHSICDKFDKIPFPMSSFWSKKSKLCQDICRVKQGDSGFSISINFSLDNFYNSKARRLRNLNVIDYNKNAFNFCLHKNKY